MARHPTENQDKGRNDGFRVLPSVAAVLADPSLRAVSSLDDTRFAGVVQIALARERAAIAGGARTTRGGIDERLRAAFVALERPALAPAINATGVLVHTNLGRAPVSAETAAAMAGAAAHAVALEIDPGTNERGDRMREIADLMRLLTGTEATLVVNNCAGAVLLALSAVGAGRSVVVSRGEAIEIGGGFRVPEVLRQSGATLVEVGTTNRTYARDYAEATDSATGAYLKMHPSNFRIEGFTHAASTAELVELGRRTGVPVLEDIGSGALLDTSAYGLSAEPTFQQSVAAGASLAMASGDKLLGGPQAGIVVGERVWIERLTRHPLARALRADKTCLAGVGTTLRHYARGEATSKIPVWRMIAASPVDVQERAFAVAARLATLGNAVAVEPTVATVGGGSLPGERLASFGVVLDAGTDSAAADGMVRRLRVGQPAVFGRIERDRVVLDLRSMLPEDDDRLVAAVSVAARSGAPRDGGSGDDDFR